MTNEIYEKIEKIFLKQNENFKYDWQNDLKNADKTVRLRIESELLGYGPINTLLSDAEITEILVNRFDCIFYEKAGVLYQSNDTFYSEQTYNSVLERLAQSCGTYLNREKPFIETQLGNLRITIIFAELSRENPLLSIRIQPPVRWTLSKLAKNNFFSTKQLSIIKNILSAKKNFLVVGGTGSGKTSF